MEIYNVKLKYKTGDNEEISTQSVWANDEEHAIHNAKIKLNIHVTSLAEKLVDDFRSFRQKYTNRGSTLFSLFNKLF